MQAVSTDLQRVLDKLTIRCTAEWKEVMGNRYIVVRLEKASNVIILS